MDSKLNPKLIDGYDSTGNGSIIVKNGDSLEYLDVQDAQSDWEVNDVTSLSHIANRTHYKEHEVGDEASIILDDSFTLTEGEDENSSYSYDQIGTTRLDRLNLESKYTITYTIDNVEYIHRMCVPYHSYEETDYMINEQIALTDNPNYESELTYKFKISDIKVVYNGSTTIDSIINVYPPISGSWGSSIECDLSIRECVLDKNLYDWKSAGATPADGLVWNDDQTIDDYVFIQIVYYDTPPSIIEGNKYIVEFDGESYIKEGVLDMSIGYMVTYIGNAGLMNAIAGTQLFPDTGEDFLIMIMPGGGMYVVLPNTIDYETTSEDSTVLSIYPYESYIYNKLDTNYLNTGTLNININGTQQASVTVLGNSKTVDIQTITGITHESVTLDSYNSIYFDRNKKSSRLISVSADTALRLYVRNDFDNILWIYNNGISDIDITFQQIKNKSGTIITNVYMPEDGITIPKDKWAEIGIIVNSTGAFITSRSDLVYNN